MISWRRILFLAATDAIWWVPLYLTTPSWTVVGLAVLANLVGFGQGTVYPK